MAWAAALRGLTALHTTRRFAAVTARTTPAVGARLLSTSLAARARPSSLVHSPRWTNKSSDREHDGENEDDHDGDHPSDDKRVPVDGQEDGTPPSAPSSSSSSASSAPSSPGSPPDSDSPGSSDPSDPPPPTQPPSNSSIAKQSVPEIYPQVLALPIARRPLFPGFYKAVVVRNPAVVRAIKDAMKRGQPYLGAFLLKDEHTDADVITDLDAVHPVGVFAQITSVFSAGSGSAAGSASGSGNAASGAPGAEEEEGLTAVLYPHRRIRITELIKPGGEGPAMAKIDEASEPQTVTPPPTPPPSEPESKVPPGPPQTSFLHSHAVSVVAVENLPTAPYNKDDQYIRAFMSELVSVFKDIAQLNPLFRDQITNFSIHQSAANVFDEPDRLADFAAAVSSGGVQELQEVLEATQVEERLRRALLVLKKELINAQLQSKLARDVDSKIAKRQREYYLMEQLKGIKRELGMETDGKDRLLEKFRERAAALKMPEGVRKVFDEELGKLAHLEPAASEANVTRNYLDWLTQIPWGTHSPENFSLRHAQGVLDADHYGLKDVKERILEFLAVGKLRGSVQGKIILLSGPPGVGKTSIGKSIARALGRQFFRFSVGGLTDVAEIKGHRRTYVGALPGKIIQALKRVGTENPLVLIDEVDKIGRGHNGDPASALLEMLDPEQNSAFLDHYMDVPVDLSRVLFVCTANNLDTIPAPLLDRMEVLEVSGYVSEEKVAIAQRYLAPQAKEASGLKDADVEIDREAVDVLIKWYCRESGVRGLKKQIEKIYRKAALKLVDDIGEETLPEPSAPAHAVTSATAKTEEGATGTVESQEPPANEPNAAPESSTSTPSETASAESSTSTPSEGAATQEDGSSSGESGEEGDRKAVTTQERQPLKLPPDVHVRVTPETLKDYVGPPLYYRDRMYTRAPPPGVSTGLGFLGNGSGAVMPIEATAMPGKGNLQLTGKLGEVIRESAQIALSWVKAHGYELGITKTREEAFIGERDIHVHMPEGSIGKEGPSAGTALLSAFVSLFTRTRVHPDIAMTGEISLVGQVLPVGGLKEKILAAHRAGIKTLLAPAANRADIEENVPASVKEGIRFVYVEEVREVLEEVFKGTELAERIKETLKD
ncbi:ATP-dependent protease La [Coniophora puteana RWD-64-598 SS2]|uniref:Lon protease homolog, mitochondrial n=1 Tax=Coniophora puteana (strain RWD-64-598) TaxID=741705 RepID=A0A5M3MZB8_CONPW|nr:ATP-dependent protease La [Coniophora puteana RWD-64-598 SS2]EIW84492.1 ATP-dependent protease La [Coniophora puteana RWD-64-598 SS2]